MNGFGVIMKTKEVRILVTVACFVMMVDSDNEVDNEVDYKVDYDNDDKGRPSHQT